MKNFLLAVALTTSVGSIGCLGYGVSQMGRTGSLTTSQSVTLFYFGFIGAHLAAVPSLLAGRID